MTPREAADLAYREARRLLGDAIDHRRHHPYEFYVYHSIMATQRRKEKRAFAAWWHRQWRTHYWAKSQASREASMCRRHSSEIGEA